MHRGVRTDISKAHEFFERTGASEMAGAGNKRKAGRAERGAVGKGMAEEEEEIAREEELKESL
ncbi:MAG: hypothetical protein MW690_001148 [Methanophagales archaeon]|nr:hypothetical protein [Methanophagales archaeon]